MFLHCFCMKIACKFDFQSNTLAILRLLDPDEMSPYLYLKNILKFPIQFDKMVVKLEFREFAVDSDIPSLCGEGDAVTFWLSVKSIESPMGHYKYANLSTLSLQLLSIPARNTDCERVFSLVRRIKTDFRSSLHADTISSLIGIHFNSRFKSCEQSDFEPSLLEKAKNCTGEKNMSYEH